MRNTLTCESIGITPIPTNNTPSPSHPAEDSRICSGSKSRVTQIDVARAAGVHSTTVSQALRNSPSISAATRQRIRALAEKMGYSPDPALRALVAYRRGIVPTRRNETIAYVTTGDSRFAWRDTPAALQCFQGAEQKAAESGYQLENFWLGEPGMSGRRLGTMLFHRGITGMMLAPQQSHCTERFDFDWERMSAVMVGRRPHGPSLHRVMHDPTGDMRTVIRRASAAGYRRIGLIIPQERDDLTEQSWSVAFTIEQQRLPASQRIPILYHRTPDDRWPGSTTGSGNPLDVSELARWFFAFQPEVVVGLYPILRDAISRLGVRIPKDMAFVDLLQETADPGVAGVRPSFRQVGEVAVENLINQLLLNHRGLPSYPTTTLVEGAWSPGASFPDAPFSKVTGSVDRCSGQELDVAVGL